MHVMGDMTIETAATCRSNVDWSTKVRGSTGTMYEVRFCRQWGGGVQHDWQCSCPAFQHRKGGQYCKHIEKVKRTRCGWNAGIDPGLRPNGNQCPKCKGPLEFIQVAV